MLVVLNNLMIRTNFMQFVYITTAFVIKQTHGGISHAERGLVCRFKTV